MVCVCCIGVDGVVVVVGCYVDFVVCFGVEGG